MRWPASFHHHASPAAAADAAFDRQYWRHAAISAWMAGCLFQMLISGPVHTPMILKIRLYQRRRVAEAGLRDAGRMMIESCLRPQHRFYLASRCAREGDMSAPMAATCLRRARHFFRRVDIVAKCSRTSRCGKPSRGDDGDSAGWQQKHAIFMMLSADLRISCDAPGRQYVSVQGRARRNHHDTPRSILATGMA